GQEARDLADSMIDTLLGKDNSLRIRNAYLKSLDKYLAKRERGEKVGMIHVFKDLMKHDDKSVQEAGDFLLTAVNQSILALGFSNGQNEAISVDSKITILEINGLNLPNDKSNIDLTPDDKKSLTIMYALGYYCTKFGKQDRTVETIEFFDEAWFFNSTTVGKQILKRMKRVGRSENNFLVFITQSVHDLSSEEDGTGFGSVFAFLEDTEIDAVLEYLKIPKNTTTSEWLGNMTMAQCIFLDTFGRKERITVDGMFPEITQLFDTVETKLKAI
ncbi:TPA: ATP-binding protein, partial [Streptococcus suis]